VKWLVLINLFN